MKYYFKYKTTMSSSGGTSYLAFDLGASNGRALLGRLRDGELSMETVHRFETPLVAEGQRLYWDMEALQRHLEEGLHQALKAAPSLRSVSVDSWSVDYVPLDAQLRPLRRPYSYRDPVRARAMKRALEHVSPEQIYAVTGIQFLPFNTLYQVLADREEEPDLFERTALRLPIADYFNHRFGGRAVTDFSMASCTQLMDARKRVWSGELLAAFDLPRAGWPEIVPSGTRTGQVTGMPGAAVVTGCSHDTACAVAATPARDEAGAWAYISCGTWSLMGVERKEPLLTEEGRKAGFTNEVGLDGVIRFLKNLTGLWVLQECMRAWKEAGRSVSYDALLREAAGVPPSDGPIDLEDPRFLERGDMLGRIADWLGEHDRPVPETPPALCRLILESLAERYRRTLTTLEGLLGRRIDTIHLVGGGSRNPLLCRLTATACRRNVVAGPAEATAAGNLLVQARTMGDLPEGLSIRDVVRGSFDMRSYSPPS